jgi:hypothetical protein
MRVMMIAAILLTTAAATPPSLISYKDKYPFGEVRGVTFFKHPLVQAAVAKAVKNPKLRIMLLSPTGPSGRVQWTARGLRADGCQAHNCGYHQWTIDMDLGGTAAIICYYNADTLPGRTRWFLPNGREEIRNATGCF